MQNPLEVIKPRIRCVNPESHTLICPICEEKKEFMGSGGWYYYGTTSTGKEWWRKHLATDHLPIIQRNIQIIIDGKASRRLRITKRRRHAIYRLYRGLNLTPWQISQLTNISCSSIRNAIGRVFKEQCKKNRCWAAKWLK